MESIGIMLGSAGIVLCIYTLHLGERSFGYGRTTWLKRLRQPFYTWVAMLSIGGLAVLAGIVVAALAFTHYR